MAVINDFIQVLAEEAVQAAINRGVPAHLARNRDWGMLTNLCPTRAGTWALLSFSDGKTVMAELTLQEIEDAIYNWAAPKAPNTLQRIASHPAHRSTSHDFQGPIGRVIFTHGHVGLPSDGELTLEWCQLQQRENSGGKYQGGVEQARIYVHLDGTVSFAKPGSYPYTGRLLKELGIELVAEKRPVNAKEALAVYQSQFFAAYAPSAERQAELQLELERFFPRS